jgi:SsrA-binding protein
MAQPESGETSERVVTTNRKARHDYHVLESLEAGIALTGTEIKSVRQAAVTLSEGFAQLRNGEIWLVGVHISPYKEGSYANVDPMRERRLLLHRKEIRKIAAKLADKGTTLVPLKIYFKGNKAKLQLGLCRGKREYDRREDIRTRDAERDLRRIHRR